MAYADATSDDRRLAGNLQFTSTALGISGQGPASSGTHSDWFTRDADGKLVAMITRDDDGKDLYYLFDGLGSVAATTDQNGDVVTRYTYEPYGQQTSPNPAAVDTNGDPVDRNPFRYASGYYDTTTGMLRYGTRYYMPNLMRWTQPDPVMGKPMNPMSLNPYSYVGCNPVNATDASGRSSLGTFLGLMGGCASAVGFFAEVSVLTHATGWATAALGPVGPLAYWSIGGLLACLGGMGAAWLGIDASFDVPIF